MVAPNLPSEIASHLDRHPSTRFVDVLLADSCGIPRGKRITIGELAGVYLGADFQRLYATTRGGEFRSFDTQVSELDHQWCLTNS